MNIEDTLQFAAEAAGVGTWQLLVHENRLQSSAKCREILGLPQEASLQYQDFLSLVHSEDLPHVEESIAQALDSSGPGLYEIDYRIMHTDGEIHWIGTKGKTFFEGLGQDRVAVRLIGTVIDRTERKMIQDALIESEKLAVMGRLAASIAYEIRNPVEAAVNLLYLLRMETSEQKRAEYIQRAEGELGRVSEIASNTLRFYRDPSGITSFDLADLVKNVLGLFHGRLAASNVKLELTLPPDHVISAPQGELRQVVANLVSNALDAMPKSGRLILRIKRFVNRRTGKPCVRLTVADSGVGMTPEVLSRVFEAFYTTKGVAGNGLGLWMSLEIMKKCGSAIRLRSAVGRGTVFQLSLEGAPLLN